MNNLLIYKSLMNKLLNYSLVVESLLENSSNNELKNRLSFFIELSDNISYSINERIIRTNIFKQKLDLIYDFLKIIDEPEANNFKKIKEEFNEEAFIIPYLKLSYIDFSANFINNLSNVKRFMNDNLEELINFYTKGLKRDLRRFNSITDNTNPSLKMNLMIDYLDFIDKLSKKSYGEIIYLINSFDLLNNELIKDELPSEKLDLILKLFENYSKSVMNFVYRNVKGTNEFLLTVLIPHDNYIKEKKQLLDNLYI